MMLDLNNYRTKQRNLKVEKVVKNFVADIRHKLFMRKMALRMYKQLHRKSV